MVWPAQKAPNSKRPSSKEVPSPNAGNPKLRRAAAVQMEEVFGGSPNRLKAELQTEEWRAAQLPCLKSCGVGRVGRVGRVGQAGVSAVWQTYEAADGAHRPEERAAVLGMLGLSGLQGDAREKLQVPSSNFQISSKLQSAAI